MEIEGGKRKDTKRRGSERSGNDRVEGGERVKVRKTTAHLFALSKAAASPHRTGPETLETMRGPRRGRWCRVAAPEAPKRPMRHDESRTDGLPALALG